MGRQNKKDISKTPPIIITPSVEINYDKLAQALIRAKEQAQISNPTKPLSVKSSIRRTLWRIFRGKADNDSLFVNSLMSVPLSTILSFIGLSGIIFIPIICIAAFAIYITAHQWFMVAADTFIQILWLLVFLIISFTAWFFSFILKAAGDELEIINDRDYIAAVFSGMVGFAALIISIIAVLN